MPRPPNPDLIKPWKTNLPATLAGKIEYLLHDPIHNRPRYAARGFLIERLLNVWLATIEGDKPNLPSVLDRFLCDAATREELVDALDTFRQSEARIPTLDEVRNARS